MPRARLTMLGLLWGEGRSEGRSKSELLADYGGHFAEFDLQLRNGQGEVCLPLNRQRRPFLLFHQTLLLRGPGRVLIVLQFYDLAWLLFLWRLMLRQLLDELPDFSSEFDEASSLLWVR